MNAIVALTTESADWLSRNTRARKVCIIPNSVTWPLAAQAPILQPPARAAGQRLLLTVGRLSEEKQFDLLIAVFKRLAVQFPNWKLVILGEGPDRSALAEQVKAAKLTDRVSLPGRAGNVGHWYEAADLYVMCSRFEGFPNTLTEALAHGLPAVSFDCDTGPRDIIRNEVDGLLLANGATGALISALARLMSDAGLRQQYAANAIDVRERFSMVKIAGLWEDLFEELRKK
jgi:glycosyltransferase involved in cell wall biosynthesis